MKTLIIEDESYNSQMLMAQIKDIRPNWQIAGILDKVGSSIEWFNENPQPDLIFMDIQLIDGICFSIFESVVIECPIIFTTAYDEYAIKAFEVNSIDYLLKPIDELKLAKAIEKFEKIYNSQQTASLSFDYNDIIKSLISNKKEYRKRILINGVEAFYKIDVEQIAYIKIESGICEAVLFNGKSCIINHTLEKLEEDLDPKYFYRANRKTIINIEAIKKVENFFGGKLSVQLIPPFNESITISRLKATSFKQWFDE